MAAVDRSQRELARNTLAGSMAVGTGVGLMNPLDTLRVRWQLLDPSSIGSFRMFFFRILRDEGLWQGLWRHGLTINMMSMALSGGIRMGTYPYFRDLISEEKMAWSMFAAGMLGGCVGFSLSAPIFQIKTRSQAEAGVLCPKTGLLLTGARRGRRPMYDRGLVSGLIRVAKNEGPLQLWRGGGVLVFRGSLLSAGQQLGYDGFKTAAKKQGFRDSPVLHLAGAASGAFFAATFAAPPDVVMTRYQTGPQMGRVYDGPLGCFRTMIREEGYTVLLRGWMPLFMRLVPLFSVMLPLYEQCRRALGMAYLD